MLTVHVQHDEHGPIEIVEEAEGKLRSLRFGSTARQSTMFTARPTELALEYTRTMASGLVFLPHQPTRVLVLGLGGGGRKGVLAWPDTRRPTFCSQPMAGLLGRSYLSGLTSL